MKSNIFIEMAKKGLKVPVATHLILHEKENPEEILLNGKRLGQVIEETAHRYSLPIPIPIMDLVIEKETILELLEIEKSERNSFHFNKPLTSEMISKIEQSDFTIHPRTRANIEAVRYIAENTSLMPIDMSIGPFSLMTKLVADPITPVYLAGSGLTASDSEEVALIESAIELSLKTVLKSLTLKIEQAKAKAIFLCEPAANLVYFSPKQMEEGSDIFDRFVVEPNRKIKDLLDKKGVDLIFHDCGDLKPLMVQKMASLKPAVFSFGSPVKLWEMEPFVDQETVIFGNLPTKKFYSDTEISLEQTRSLADEITEKMKATGHYFILGSECDILSMPGHEKTIKEKVKAFCGCGHC